MLRARDDARRGARGHWELWFADCAALQGDAGIEVVAASRSGGVVRVADDIRTVVLDAFAPDLSARLSEVPPNFVIHCVGSFQ